MSTTSLYNTTQPTGTVSTENLTSLYSNATNFTTGVVSSSVYSVNGGTGVTVNPTTGNVTVSIGQAVDTTDNVTFANIHATGNLSNNYFTLANSAGTNGQVLTTNGAGTTSWTTPSSLGLVTSVSGSGAGISVTPTTGNVVVTNTGVTSIVAGSNISISGATGAVTVNAANTTYNIDASTTTGGANLNLTGSDSTTDSVKFAGSGATTITRTDANTITISSTSGSTIPNGTSQGQVLYWDGSAWTADSTITATASTSRLTAVYKNSTPGASSVILARKDFGASTYTTNDGVAYSFQLDSDSQATNQLASIAAAWNATAPIITLNTNINNNTAGPFVTVGSFTSAQATLPGDLAVNGGDITTTQTTASLFNATPTTLNIGGAATTINVGASTGIVNFANDINVIGGDITTVAGGIANLYNNNAVDTINIGNSVVTEVNIGNTSGSRVQIKSPTIVGANTTQAVFNTVATTVNAFGAATAVNIGAATGTTTIGHDLTVNGGNINLNGTATAGVQPFLTFETQPDGTNSLYGIRGKSTVDDPWFIGAGSAGDDLGYLEIATGDNSGLSNSGGEIYVRQYNGATPGTGVPWYGGNGTVVNELILLDNVGNTTIPNNLTVDSGTLFVDATNNRVGINTITPGYALDVVGDANVSGNITCSQIAVDGISTYNSQTTTTTSTATTAISSTTRASQKSIIRIIDNVSGEIHMLEALAFHKGATAYLTTYAEMYSSAALATFTASYSGGAINILATPASANSTTFTVARISLD